MGTKNPFDYLKAINNTKVNILENEKDYPSFMVNRGLSYFPDTVLLANEMNMCAHLDNELKFSFLINSIRKRKRFSKWNKVTESADINAIKKYYGYSNEKARDVLSLLTNNEMKLIKERIDHGGTK